MQTQEDHSDPIPALHVDSLKIDLVVIQNTCYEERDSISENATNNLYQMTDTYFVEYTGIEVQHFRDTLLQHLGNVKKSVAERNTSSKTVWKEGCIKGQVQRKESKIDMGKLCADLFTRKDWTDSIVQDDSSRSGNDTDADDADIRPIYD
ncbi:hypothetical protein Tco_1410594 [Tanacetum coccineum]